VVAPIQGMVWVRPPSGSPDVKKKTLKVSKTFRVFVL
jgi:hypothetical protein